LAFLQELFYNKNSYKTTLPYSRKTCSHRSFLFHSFLGCAASRFCRSHKSIIWVIIPSKVCLGFLLECNLSLGSFLSLTETDFGIPLAYSGDRYLSIPPILTTTDAETRLKTLAAPKAKLFSYLD
jgi:hypothetical protein